MHKNVFQLSVPFTVSQPVESLLCMCMQEAGKEEDMCAMCWCVFPHCQPYTPSSMSQWPMQSLQICSAHSHAGGMLACLWP